jgi:hypothetical protein
MAYANGKKTFAKKALEALKEKLKKRKKGALTIFP